MTHTHTRCCSSLRLLNRRNKHTLILHTEGRCLLDVLGVEKQQRQTGGGRQGKQEDMAVAMMGTFFWMMRMTRVSYRQKLYRKYLSFYPHFEPWLKWVSLPLNIHDFKSTKKNFILPKAAWNTRLRTVKTGSSTEQVVQNHYPSVRHTGHWDGDAEIQ